MSSVDQILQECTVVNNVVKLPPVQLDRNQYLEVKKSLELIGGKWKGGKVSGFEFLTDPSDLLAQVSKGVKRNIKKEFQFFATPNELADYLVFLADLQNHDTILEPSAGQGAILNAINKVSNTVPDCYELMDVNVSVLKQSNYRFNLIGSDFLKHTKGEYSKIIANPPFTKNQDIDHLKRMYNALGRGGRLVCITSNSWRNGNQKKQMEFKKWLEDKNYDIEELDAGTFKQSGTMVSANIVIINKPLHENKGKKCCGS